MNFLISTIFLTSFATFCVLLFCLNTITDIAYAMKNHEKYKCNPFAFEFKVFNLFSLALLHVAFASSVFAVTWAFIGGVTTQQLIYVLTYGVSVFFLSLAIMGTYTELAKLRIGGYRLNLIALGLTLVIGIVNLCYIGDIFFWGFDKHVR